MNDVDPAAQGPADDPSLTDNLAAAARRSGFGKVTPGQTPTASALLGAMGGVRGLIESILPGLAFVVVYTITGLLLPSVLVPIVISVGFVIARIVAKQPYTSALAGVLGIALSAGVALVTGQAKDNFVLGFVINGAFLAALLISIAVRWPLIGVIASLITSEGSEWRANKAKFRVALIGTIIWVALFAVRLAVELPLYFADATQALGALKLVLGVPLYAATLWVTWLLVRTVYARPDPD
ncbi:MAG: hypothetical protein JWP19_1947 [Rhodoglobus sp.]|nr:hypothetical protein [Rhodoglobus sp.]